MPIRHRRQQAGFTFAELAFALVILVIGATVLINHLTINYLTTNTERDRVFAYSKAQAILSEIQVYVDRGQVDAAVDLDVLDDGIVNRQTLSIQTDQFGALIAPDHVLSGNYQRNGQWIWSRRISVQPFVGINNRNVRYVTVRIFRRDNQGVDQPFADLSAVINSAGSAFPTTQVFDIYLIAIENIPGWWVYMDSIQPFVESMITDLETRNPGLQFRTHWITKASFGRNQGYRPYTNEANDSLATIPEVYHYPGRMPAGNASSYYYVPDTMSARINVDGVERNGYDADTNPHPYALADFFNHAMRYPDELALWQQRVDAIEQREADIAAAVAASSTPPPEFDDMSKEPTLRLLLEDMYSSPEKYRNALMINLHGELLPMPALRNFSDAARDPVNHPEVRVVTHPAELRTYRDAGAPESASDQLEFRVYAYNTNHQTYTGSQTLGDPLVIEVMGLDLTDGLGSGRLGGSCALEQLRGGVPVGLLGDTAYYPFQTARYAGSPLVEPGEMCYRAQFVDPGTSGSPRFTRIYLYNTPVVAPPVGGAGLENTERAMLYRMPYVPCPVEAARTFATDLASVGSGPKNTARWRLRIDPEVFGNGSFVDDDGNRYRPSDDVVVQVRTRIWSSANPDPAGSGTMWPPSARNQPDNLSVTYAWWADSAEDVPITERYQFQGDPRHVPYKDLFNADPDFPNGYNWFRDSLVNNTEPGAADYASIDAARLRNRWNASMAIDVPRYFEVLRKALLRSKVVYTTLTGYSYYYLGIGNDIGYDSANGYPNSIPSELTPHGIPSGTGYLNTITGARRVVREGSAAAYWWGMPWLGELFPDSAVSTWQALDGLGAMRGNLDAGTASNQFYQSTENSIYAASNRTAYGTALLNHHQRTAGPGCTAFFNIGTAAAHFGHVSSSGTGPLTAVGTELANNYNMTVPTSATITRPFGLALGGTTGEHWAYAPYTTDRCTATLYRTYYTHGSGTGSGLVKLVDPSGTSAAYVVVNGIGNAVDTGTTFIAKWAMVSLVHSFFEAGSTTNTLRIPQLPRVEIESPTDITELINPGTITIQYDVDWTRWDGTAYTATGTFAEDELELEYVLMYSPDNGTTWLHVQDDSLATPGTRPTDLSHIVDDAGVGAEAYAWDVPAAQFPEGGYLLRIDCYRRDSQVHYSYHKTKIFIQR